MDDHGHRRLVEFCPRCEDKRECHVDGEYLAQDVDIYLYLLVHCNECCRPMLLVQEPEPFGDMSLTRPPTL